MPGNSFDYFRYSAHVEFCHTQTALQKVVIPLKKAIHAFLTL
jgi:hypothetical protein